MKKRWALTEETIFAASIAAAGCAFFLISLGYPAQSRFFPTLVIIPLVLGMLAVAITGARVPLEGKRKAADTRRTFLITAGWMVGLIVLMALTGLVGSMTLFPILYMRFYCQEEWRPTLITAAVLGAGTWVFIRFLQIPMYPGVILGALGF